MKKKLNCLYPRARKSRLISFALLPVMVAGVSRGDELLVDPPGPGAADLVRTNDQTIWFDSNNTNTPVAVSTINGAVPATGFLPGWAHTRWSFVKYDGANVVEIPNTEKLVGTFFLSTATATSAYYDNQATSSLGADFSVGLIETTRDFIIDNGKTLNVAMGGLMFHNNSHWLKAASGTASITSSSHQLVVTANGGSTDYQISGVVVKDFDATHPLQFIKTGADPLNLSAANTHTGGTLVLNGVLRGSNTASFGTQTVKVQGANSQLFPSGAGTYANPLELAGRGPNSGGALRLGNGAVLSGPITLTAAAKIAAEGTDSGVLNGTISGTEALEFNNTGTATGTITLNGSAAALTGPADVMKGRLNLNNALGGDLTIWAEASLGGEGSVAGNVLIGATDGTPSRIFVNGATPGALAIAGDLFPAGPIQIIPTAIPTDGSSFTALSYGTFSGDVASFTVAGARAATVTDNPTAKTLVVSLTPGDIVWTGSVNANWALTADTNFLLGATATPYFTGDRVTFDDSSAVAPTIVGTLYPSLVTFNRNTDLVVTGTGAGLAGGASIVKTGTGAVTLGGQSSTFTGPIAINAGVLRPGNAEAFGNASSITVAAGAQADINGFSPSATLPARNYSYTLAGDGPGGLGALTNSAAGGANENSGIRNITLTADASVGTSAGRFDVGFTNGTVGTITGNGHTFTKIGTTGMGIRGNAGGSPIKFVIAAGAAWGESHDNAWGGATGLLTIKSGARAGTYGTRTIATPVVVESGGTFYNEGGGTGTWTGPVSVSGNVIFNAGTAMVVSGVVSGAGSIDKTGGNTLTVAQPQWSGETSVTDGVLSLGQPNPNNETATVRIAAVTTAKLNLNFTGSDTVATLFVGGVQQPAGTYDATNLPDHITGTGSLVVTSSASGYSAWAAGQGIGAASDDADNDGVPNGIEYVVGGDPTGANSIGLLPVATTETDYLVFSFRRSTLSQSGPESQRPYVQYSTAFDLWLRAVPGVDGVTEEVGATEVAPGVYPVTVRIPRALSADGKIFARLRIDIE